MAWKDTYLLSPILLVLLASGCCTELFQAVEGQTFSVNCPYDHRLHINMMKVWCQQTSTEHCKVLVSSLSTDTQQPKFSIRDHPDSRFFTVTMTALTVRDSGVYYCGIHDNGGTITVLRTMRLVVSRGHSNTTASAMIPTWPRTEAPPFNTTKDMSTVFSRVSISSMVVPVVCGLFIKTLIFTVLFAVTQRSFE
ncbi:triggering receptor expressed on myeloid cells 1-like [Arvicola amphibius]|uniref:triggering receptor expressed on myeloid cells 1-like n=1 Tax=Arvicola amphibius TaxID=1047088 RepID=UPI0018E3582E|nr:triggering receptor expressed on myeloid cells 1-like [Arvicola amphibius]